MDLHSTHPHVETRTGVRGGAPIVRGTRITTAEVARFVRDEEGDDQRVATAYGLDVEAVRDAVAYETELEEELTPRARAGG